MIVFPNAKINVGLNVVSRRVDGYHNLETVLFPIKLCDALEMVEAKETLLTVSGIEIDGKHTDNLVLKAYRLLSDDYSLPPVHFHLHKVIPFGAGLGGGSSDAAYTLKMLNDFFNLSLNTGALEHYAAKIGADCPFFIQNKPVFATGIGNEFQALNLDLNAFEILILKPNCSVSTQEAYQNVVPGKPSHPLHEAIQQAIETWKDRIFNDFEQSVFLQYPEVQRLKEIMYQLGAVYAAMSGSGSAVFGVFRHLPTDFADKIPPGIFIYR